MKWPWSRSVSSVAKAAAAGGFAPPPASPPTKPSGSDGVASYGGFLVSGERDPRLVGTSKWITYDNATLNIAIVASAINVWTQLGGSAKWSVKPNKRGGKDAERAADIVREGLLEAQMSTPWRQVVRRQMMKKFRGFALHEVVIRRRSDDVVIVADLLDRPAWTVHRWNKPDDQSGWLGLEQLTRFGDTKYVERERLFYSVENTLGSSPEGVGLLRQIAEPARVLELYQRWEGIGLQTDLRGIPIARAPFGALRNQIDPNKVMNEVEVRAAIASAVKFMTDFLENHNKRSDQGICLDSETYRSLDAADSPSSIAMWGLDLLKGATSSIPEVGVAIGRLVRDCARICGAEFLLLGDVGSGSDAMHEDKTAMFGLYANSALDDIADDGKRDIATRLVVLNGLDPDTCTPDLQHEPVMRGAVADACRSLMTMFQAGLNPRDPAINILRNRMDLPDAPDIDETEFFLPRGAQIERMSPDGSIVAADQPAPTPATPGQAGNVNARPA